METLKIIQLQRAQNCPQEAPRVRAGNSRKGRSTAIVHDLHLSGAAYPRAQRGGGIRSVGDVFVTDCPVEYLGGLNNLRGRRPAFLRSYPADADTKNPAPAARSRRHGVIICHL